uniref:Phosphoglycolate phosphatase n=1 Tax=Lotharella globosa TaxID=91324 RepID=A0A7S3YTM9_9EUKA
MAEAMGSEFDACIIEKVSSTNVPTFQGVVPLISELKERGTLLAVLSNASGDYVRRVNQVHQIKSLFQVEWGADDAILPKPNPDGLLKILEIMALKNPNPDNTVYIGDSISDGKAAQAAGITSIGVTWGENTHATLEGSGAFDRIFTQVPELAKFLLGDD